tara:strand:- start:2965 stop:3687 length:723 start_codon:yes stop_codon:yes gene_type:complete
MIVVESQKRRGFIGRLETGQDVVAGIRDFCVRERVETAFFSGFGYVSNPVVRIFRPEHKRYLKGEENLTGHYLLTSVQGSVSFHQEARELNIMATCRHAETGDVVVAELLEAEVISFEFSVRSFDDVRLYRDHDEHTGLRQWVMMELVDGSGQEETPVESAEPEASAQADTAEPIEIAIGDFLEHPRLGLCEVIDLVGDSRLAIRLQTDRIVELHRGIINLESKGEKDGHRVFNVSIRRK